MTRPTIRSTYQDRPASVPLISAAGIGAFLLLAIVGTALLFLSLWWFRWRVNADADIRRDGFDFQVSAEDRVLDLNTDLAAIDTQLATPGVSATQRTQLQAQRTAIATDLCDTAARVNHPKAAVVAIITKEC